ncbi:unnamed protein product [Caretta caretta]
MDGTLVTNDISGDDRCLTATVSAYIQPSNFSEGKSSIMQTAIHVERIWKILCVVTPVIDNQLCHQSNRPNLSSSKRHLSAFANSRPRPTPGTVWACLHWHFTALHLLQRSGVCFFTSLSKSFRAVTWQCRQGTSAGSRALRGDDFFF